MLWQVKDLGEGYSIPAVVGDRLYVLTNTGTKDEFLRARSVKDGKKRSGPFALARSAELYPRLGPYRALTATSSMSSAPTAISKILQPRPRHRTA